MDLHISRTMMNAYAIDLGASRCALKGLEDRGDQLFDLNSGALVNEFVLIHRLSSELLIQSSICGTPKPSRILGSCNNSSTARSGVVLPSGNTKYSKNALLVPLTVATKVLALTS